MTGDHTTSAGAALRRTHRAPAADVVDDTTGLFTLMYTSAAALVLSDDEVAILLSRSRERNVADGVTGLLVYIRLDDDRAAFLQVLEGARHVVEGTYARIERDELHRDLTVLLRSPIETARFAQWSMKFATLEESGLRQAADEHAGSDVAVLLRDRATMTQAIALLGEA